MTDRSRAPAPSRRALFAVALPVAVAATAPAAGAAGLIARTVSANAAPLQQRLAEHQAGLAAYDSGAGGDDAYDALGQLRDHILTAPISCPSDAAAKVRMAAVSLDEGALFNELDCVALAQVAAWLERL